MISALIIYRNTLILIIFRIAYTLYLDLLKILKQTNAIYQMCQNY